MKALMGAGKTQSARRSVTLMLCWKIRPGRKRLSRCQMNHIGDRIRAWKESQNDGRQLAGTAGT